MKLSFALGILGATTLLSASASAQIIVGDPGNISLLQNMVSNPGFEHGLTSWDRSGGYIDNSYYGTTLPTNLGYPTGEFIHNGYRSFNFGINNESWVTGFYSPIRQMLISPTAGSSIIDASVYVYAPGQHLNVKILYTDNTVSMASSYFNGLSYSPQYSMSWQRWDFKWAINPNKIVKGIEFSAYSDKWFPANIAIDDVMIAKRMVLRP